MARVERVSSTGFLLLESGDVGEVAVLLVEVEPVADHEDVRDGEALVLYVQVDLAFHVLFVEQGADLERGRATCVQVLEQVAQREPGVDDVFDDDDVPALDVRVQVLEDPHHTGRLHGRAVGRARHEVEGDRDSDGAGQVRQEDEGAFEDTDHQYAFRGVVAAYRARKIPHAPLDVSLTEHDLVDLGQGSSLVSRALSVRRAGRLAPGIIFTLAVNAQLDGPGVTRAELVPVVQPEACDPDHVAVFQHQRYAPPPAAGDLHINEEVFQLSLVRRTQRAEAVSRPGHPHLEGQRDVGPGVLHRRVVFESHLLSVHQFGLDHGPPGKAHDTRHLQRGGSHLLGGRLRAPDDNLIVFPFGDRRAREVDRRPARAADYLVDDVDHVLPGEHRLAGEQPPPGLPYHPALQGGRHDDELLPVDGHLSRLDRSRFLERSRCGLLKELAVHPERLHLTQYDFLDHITELGDEAREQLEPHAVAQVGQLEVAAIKPCGRILRPEVLVDLVAPYLDERPDDFAGDRPY